MVLNSTFVGNYVNGNTGGLALGGGATVANSIFRDNRDEDGFDREAQISLGPTGVSEIWYNSVQDCPEHWTVRGNIDVEARFVDPAGPDGIVGTEDDNLRLSADS